MYLGLNRASVGSQLQSNPLLAARQFSPGPEVFPGLTSVDVANAIPSLNTNYVNRGAVALLPDADGTYRTISSLSDAANVGKSEHVVSTYLSRIEAVTNSTGDDQAGVGITPTTTGVQVFRFFDTRNGTHFYTASASERDQTAQTRTDLTYEGVGLNGARADIRLQRRCSGSSTPGRVALLHGEFVRGGRAEGEHASGLTYEGVAFYEDATAQANDTAVYRFFNTVDGTHFYTPNQNEFASVLASRGDMVNEGIAFYTQKS